MEGCTIYRSIAKIYVHVYSNHSSVILKRIPSFTPKDLFSSILITRSTALCIRNTSFCTCASCSISCETRVACTCKTSWDVTAGSICKSQLSDIQSTFIIICDIFKKDAHLSFNRRLIHLIHDLVCVILNEDTMHAPKRVTLSSKTVIRILTSGIQKIHSVPVQLVPSPVKARDACTCKTSWDVTAGRVHVTVVSIQSTFIIIYNKS